VIVGLSGYARCGKDTAAKTLIDHGFVRVSFADKLRAFLLALNPIILQTVEGRGVRLAEIVEDSLGWEDAKDDFPEVRALLQRCGTEAGRQVLGENVWVEATLRDLPNNVVVTDVRFPNEAQAIKDLGGRIIRITRPHFGPTNPHPSETALDDWTFDHHVVNDGDLGDLSYAIRQVAT
jgi:hypothetical protein